MTTHARDLHAQATVIDTHNDLLMLLTAEPAHQRGQRFREHWLPQLRTGGVDVQVLPVFIDDEFRPDRALRETLHMIETAHRIAEHNADEVDLCGTAAEIDVAIAAGRIALAGVSGLATFGC
ncbi:MAG: membrane dipeptidase [Mycobacteriales bacterium]